jgi:hypothetical protein
MEPRSATGVAGVFAGAFAILGAAALVLRLVQHARRLVALRVVSLGLFALLLGLYAAGSIWGDGFENPLFVESLCNGYAHIDTLYLATLANMLRTYGVCSTGVGRAAVRAVPLRKLWDLRARFQSSRFARHRGLQPVIGAKLAKTFSNKLRKSDGF